MSNADVGSESVAQEVDWAAERGIATESNIDRFIESVGGARVDTIFPNACFQNADYIFEDKKILIELKILETQFGSTEQFAQKEHDLHKDIAHRFGFGPIVRMEREVAEYYASRRRQMYRAPIARIAKKANNQLRETRQALGDNGYRGILWIVNDNFREIGTDFAVQLLCSTLIGTNSHVRAFIYVTNHYVAIPGNDYANLLWVPAYADADADGDLPDFVNWLGSKWGAFCERGIGTFGNQERGSDIDLIAGARPISPAESGTSAIAYPQAVSLQKP